MMPMIKNYMLASADSVAVDAISAKMMGFDPMNICCIRIAHERGLGVGRPQEIEVVGEDISDIDFKFRQSDNFVSRSGKLFWFGPLKSLQKLMFHTPLVYFFIFGSFLYHDYLWWPTEGKKRMKQISHSEWYKLFESYAV